jgi:uncharacterized protein YcgI (DUF1989 family)
MAPTDAAYQATKGSPLDVDRRFYDQLAVRTGSARLVQSFEIPARSGLAWEVPAGYLCRIMVTEAPQVGDLNVWNRHNPRERLWASRTRQLQRAHVSTYDRLWSNLPYLRPLLTITDDTLAEYGVDADGGRVHDLLGTRCDPYINTMLSGEDFDHHCHSNLTRAVAPYGLTEFDVHDVLNVFQCTGLNEHDQYFMKRCPARLGDHFEFFAEIDLLCALSTCPGGDLSVPLWGLEAGDPAGVCHPLGVEVYRPDDAQLAGWRSPATAGYAGRHGLAAQQWTPNAEQRAAQLRHAKANHPEAQL